MLLCLWCSAAHGQHTLSVVVTEAETSEPLVGATIEIKPLQQGAVTDVEGKATLSDLPAGTYEVHISFVGFEEQIQAVQLPLNQAPLRILLATGEELEEIIVTTTRSSRVIDDIPTRVEVLNEEELNEKAIMRSANIAMLLRESTGIMMQQTSASSANQSIRIQGLDGRYTQLLKDGFPLFGGFSGGLSIMQIPPLDLRQVEIIKGSNATLYGGGAIAGLVNLVTYTPDQGNRTRLMLDQSTAGGTTFNAFLARKWSKWGMTWYTSANRQEAYDPNNDDFSNIPQIRSLTVNPSLFYYPSPTASLRLTLNSTFENRLGGDMQLIDAGVAGVHQFSEENRSDRLSYQLTYEQELSRGRRLTFKNSLTYFDRELEQPEFEFAGRQYSSFSELSYSFGTPESAFITGANLYTDRFVERAIDPLARDYADVTAGVFTQHQWQFTQQLALESGIRLDANADYGLYALPRVSFLAKIAPALTARLGGGLGYKLPTIFTEEAENLAYRSILPVDTDAMEAERSAGANVDVNLRLPLGKEWALSLNQLFFITSLQDALVLREGSGNARFFENADGPVRSQGLETNLKLTYRHWKLFANYAFNDTRLLYDNLDEQKPLTPRHSLGTVLVYEEEDKWRLGFEAYYTGSQFRSDRSETDDFWIVGVMLLRKWEHLSIYTNFENFTDTRQERLEVFEIGAHSTPDFPEIWAPTDGFIVNVGLIFDW